MKAAIGIIAVLIALAVLVLLVWLAFVGASYLLINWSSLDKSWVTLALISFTAVLIGARIIAGGRVRAVVAQRNEDARNRRSEIYLRIVQVWTSDADQRADGQWEEKLSRVEMELALLGQPQVIRTYASFRAQARRHSHDIGPALATLMKAMRKDIRRELTSTGEVIDLMLKLENDSCS